MNRYVIFLAFVAILFFKSYGQDSLSIKSRLDTLSKEVAGLNETVDFSLVDVPLSELLRSVAELHDLNVNLGNLPQTSITNNFTNVLVKDLLVFICEEYQLDIRFTNNIFTFYREEVPLEEPVRVEVVGEDLLNLNFQSTPLSEAAREITAKTGYNVVAHQSVYNQVVNAYVRDMKVEKAIEVLAEANNLKAERHDDAVIHLSAVNPPQDQQRNYRQTSNYRPDLRGIEYSAYQKNGKPFVSISCYRAPVNDLVKQICDQLKINYLLLSESNGTLSCRLDSVSFEVFLSVALESSAQAYSISQDGVYLIGDDKKGGLTQANVYSFQNRTVEGVEEVIPQPLLQQVSVKAFNDLNALIITGNEQSSRKLLDFLKQIDRSVPNVLIEVMVVEVRKGSSVRTGIKAFLGDSVPNTSGQIFSGVDVTLSSQTFNRILNNLDSRGIMNLGRVTPSFYATVQAMEENNDLEISSTPKLSTLNGHEATLTIGQSVYYLIETQNVTGGVNPIVTVTPRYEKVEANLDLKITPFVSDLQDVTMKIEAEFSDFIAPEVQGAPPGNATRKFLSKIRVKNEEMIVIGGLEEASKSQTGSGIPWLSRIPVLSWFFSSKSRDKSESKLLIFVKPTVQF